MAAEKPRDPTKKFTFSVRTRTLFWRRAGRIRCSAALDGYPWRGLVDRTPREQARRRVQPLKAAVREATRIDDREGRAVVRAKLRLAWRRRRPAPAGEECRG